ncbi:MAG: hypothetical protein PWR10_1500 [Halanaerobiales bacterium]|nr:hypothetical protein [Halanaerobiales bacterium]
MLITFILSPGDSIVLIKTLFEIGRWLMENKGAEVIFYLPDLKNLNLLPRNLIEIRWLKKVLQPSEIPKSDIIISTQPDLLRNLKNLNRGELIYLKQRERDSITLPEGIKVISFKDLRPALPPRLFKQAESKRNKIIVAGEGLNKKRISQLFTAFEKVASTLFPIEVVILDSREVFNINTGLDYQFLDTGEVELIELLATSFYMIYLGEDSFPLLPLWAMAAGVIVINLNLSKKEGLLPLELRVLDPVELALNMIKVFKLGQFRAKAKSRADKIVKNYELDRAGEEWSNYLEDTLMLPAEVKTTTRVKPQSELKGEKELIDLVITNYNTRDYLEKCITSIKKYTDLSYRLIVVDNGSTDGSLEYLRRLSNIELIENKENLGYAGACNQGILAGDGDFIVLLNSDIEVTEGWIQPLIETAREEGVAVVGPKLINKNNEIVGAGVTRLDDALPRGWKQKDGPGVFGDKEDVISVGGACYLIKRELLPVLGLFDEGYFFYFEELDYSLRAREKGYRVVYCPEAKIYHHHEGSLTPGDYEGRLQRNKYFSASKRRFLGKWAEVVAGSEKRREHKQVIIGGLIPWDYRQQRPQHLVRNLVKQGYQVLYLNPVCGNTTPREVEKNIHVYSPPGYGTVIYNIKVGNEEALGRGVNEKIRDLGFENSFLILDAPYWTPLLKFWEYSLLVYDCMDNYIGFEDLARDEEWILKMEKQLLDLADLVLVSAEGLYQEMKEKNENTYLLPNGVDLEHFNYQYNPGSKPQDIPNYSKIIGYYGAIADWFDTDLVASLAKELPEVGFVLIGEVSTDVNELNQLSNVYFLGEKPYSILPDYLAYFNLALIPFKENELTKMTDPVKVYEYLAAGKPVLATNLPELKKFADVVEIAGNEEDFIGRARKILESADEPEKRKERFKFVSGETWENRAAKLTELLHLAYYGLFPTAEEADLADEDLADKRETTVAKLAEPVNDVEVDTDIRVIPDDNEDYQESVEMETDFEVKTEENIVKSQKAEKSKKKAGWLKKITTWIRW